MNIDRFILKDSSPNTMELQFNSQIQQDKWICQVLENLKNGTWVDIGCGAPIYINNTYVLENQLGWKGISLDLDKSSTDQWREVGRDTKMVFNQDALTTDYKKLFEECNMPKVIDYLSLDLEPPQLTLQALYKIPFDDYKFKCVTYETDVYRTLETVEPSRKLFAEKGYILVQEMGSQDDFYIHPDCVN
tara:strand:- start:7225 stop:7791 length:567 start_codon:yes stop_codon:yes gene_type:complete